MKRRDFLRSTGWFVVGASLVGFTACDDASKDAPPDAGSNTPPPDTATGGVEPVGTYTFPQGVASGDPRQASVVLWTRVAKPGADAGDIAIHVQVSTDATFATMVVDKALSAPAASDNTVRVLVTELQAGTSYYYRFTAGSDTVFGRTRTAAAANADVQVNLAWVSCQDYTAGHYGAYRQMIVDDDARSEANKIHAVVHLGDMIYETRADGFQTALDDRFETIGLTNADGTPRVIGPFPSNSAATFAHTVDDYRHLYKTFLADPDIRAARARWPFICIWDDHEFTDDCWQSQANYTDNATNDEASQSRKVAASQAWFEFTPAQLTGADGVTGVASEAKDFAPVTVTDTQFPAAPNADNFIAEPNNVAAVGAITIYRSFRFGKHVELVMTDERSYRSDHAVPEDIITAVGAQVPGLFFVPRNVLPLPLVTAFDQGATATPPANPFMLGPIPIPNPRVQSPPGTMLGKQQKAWWKATMSGSDATWKLWGNEVTLMRLKIQKLGATDPADRVMAADSWDGYPTERKELMSFLRSESIKNVVLLSGDIHAAFAGVVMDDFDAAAPTPVACELVGPGVTSNSLFSFFENATRSGPGAALRGLTTIKATANGGPEFPENLNNLLLNGFVAAGTFAQAIAANVPFAQALGASLAAADPTTNPHLKYADTNSQGYGYVKVTSAQIEGTITTINRPIGRSPNGGPGYKRRASFTIPKDNPGGMTGPEFLGTKPFPLG
jgi:alkaline phosphatase D